jgi:hypothetical protein
MTNVPTYDDANLILRLYELRRELKMRQAREWFLTDFRAATPEEFEALCPPGSEHHAYFRMVVTYWDMAASFVVSGVLNAELFFESNQEMLAVWEKLRPLIPAWRERFKHPYIAHNLEKAGDMFLKWGAGRAPEFYASFGDGIRGLTPR